MSHCNMCDIQEATMKNPKVRQIILPLITAMIWGSSFVTQSLSAGHLGCFS